MKQYSERRVKKMINNKILNMRLPDELDGALKRAAKERRMSQASLVRMVFAEWLKNNTLPAKQEGSAKAIFDSLPGFVTSGGLKA